MYIDPSDFDSEMKESKFQIYFFYSSCFIALRCVCVCVWGVWEGVYVGGCLIFRFCFYIVLFHFWFRFLMLLYLKTFTCICENMVSPGMIGFAVAIGWSSIVK